MLKGPPHSQCWWAGGQGSWGPASGESPARARPPYLAGLEAPGCSSHVPGLWGQVQGNCTAAGSWVQSGEAHARVHAADHGQAPAAGAHAAGRGTALVHVSMRNKIKRSTHSKLGELACWGEICAIKTPLQVLKFSLNKDTELHCNSGYVQVMWV